MFSAKCLVRIVGRGCGIAVLQGILLFHGANVQAAKPSVAAALQLAPIQKLIEIERPAAEDQSRCTIMAETHAKIVGWYVRHPEGRLLRRFLDENGDNKVDQWCYYQNGIEVYRDIDADFNGTADQSRWLGTAGTRWGIDLDEDGTIDQWRHISAEEVSMELLQAIRDQDAKRFQALLLSASELEKLQLGAVKTTALKTSAASARAGFVRWAQQQNVVRQETQWIHFSGGRPGLVPLGTDGSRKDLVVYDQSLVVVETAGAAAQVNMGTMVQVGYQWRLVGLPVISGDMVTADAGGMRFFQASLPRNVSPENTSPAGANAAAQAILAKLETLDRQLAAATTVRQQAQLNDKRVDLLEQLVASAEKAEMRNTWIQQLADTVSAAVQAGQYDGGITRLERLAQELARQKDLPNLAYVRFRYLAARYGQQLQSPKADYQKIQDQWVKDLTQLIEQFVEHADVSEAMLQLAIAHEFAGSEEQAIQWYTEVVDRFGQTDKAVKARGARRRLEAVGKVLDLKGNTVDGKQLDLKSLRGRVVLVHYWASWCEPCKQDFKVIESAYAKYRQAGFTPIGINLDSDRAAATRQLRTTPLAWPQLYEAGGLDSRLANELGVMTLPTMLLIDQQGKVVNRGLHASSLADELAELLKK